MISRTLRRIAPQIPKLACGVAAAFCLSASVGNAQSVIQITDWAGNVIPAHAHLYTMAKKCSNPQGMPNATVCDWYVRRLYGNNYPVVVVIHVPGVDPACGSGYTQLISPGYTRSGCALTVTAADYGVN